MLTPAVKALRASEIRELLKLVKRAKDIISFAGGIPDPKYFPRKELVEITRKVIEEYGDYSLQYSETQGVMELREALADFLYRVRGIKADPENILVTTGSQQSLDIVARAFITPGSKVITESPSYLAAIGVFKLAGADLVGIKMDGKGMKTLVLEETVKKLIELRCKPKFIYTIPVAQNPGGVTMSLERKKHLLEIASQHDLLIVEDDPYSYFVFDENADITALKALDKEDRVIYISTLSKILAPGIRLGWMVIPKELTRRLELLKQYLDLHSPTLNQYIFTEALRTGLVEKHIKKLKNVYKVKRDTMISAMDEYFPSYTWYSRPIGGFFVFTYVFKKNFDSRKLMNVAIEKYKVAYVPGQGFHPDGSGANSMRLSFSYPDPDTIREGIKRLARLIEEV
ncbi:MAG: PLP-dependent aminotransferase family protein [Desulfurococcales archaeon]|nr:PLP-dependent aminotransferase family protein [Desulfurococcales archaeon]